MGYERVVMLDSDLEHVNGFEREARQFAETFGFRLEHLSCRTTLLDLAYDQAKVYMDKEGRQGEWEAPPVPTPLE
jgi:hypothetical protein